LYPSDLIRIRISVEYLIRIYIWIQKSITNTGTVRSLSVHIRSVYTPYLPWTHTFFILFKKKLGKKGFLGYILGVGYILFEICLLEAADLIQATSWHRSGAGPGRSKVKNGPNQRGSKLVKRWTGSPRDQTYGARISHGFDLGTGRFGYNHGVIRARLASEFFFKPLYRT
jgi:hypothetical protein